jgi:hypothetical protein
MMIIHVVGKVIVPVIPNNIKKLGLYYTDPNAYGDGLEQTPGLTGHYRNFKFVNAEFSANGRFKQYESEYFVAVYKKVDKPHIYSLDAVQLKLASSFEPQERSWVSGFIGQTENASSALVPEFQRKWFINAYRQELKIFTKEKQSHLTIWAQERNMNISTTVGNDNELIAQVLKKMLPLISFNEYNALSKLYEFAQLSEPLTAFGVDEQIGVAIGFQLFIQVYPSLHNPGNIKYLISNLRKGAYDKIDLTTKTINWRYKYRWPLAVGGTVTGGLLCYYTGVTDVLKLFDFPLVWKVGTTALNAVLNLPEFAPIWEKLAKSGFGLTILSIFKFIQNTKVSLEDLFDWS